MGSLASLGNAAGLELATQYAIAYFSGDSPIGLFHPPATDAAAQAAMLAAVDKFLSPATAEATLGPEGDGRLTGEDMEELFPMLPGGVSPGLDGLPYEFYIHFFFLTGLLHWRGLPMPPDEAVSKTAW